MTKREVFRKFIASVPGVDGEAIIARVDILQPGALDKEAVDPEAELRQLHNWHAVAKSLPIQQVTSEVQAMEEKWARRN